MSDTRPQGPPTHETLIRPCVRHAAPPDADLLDLIVATQNCASCLVTHPQTGEWVTCRSVAPY